MIPTPPEILADEASTAMVTAMAATPWWLSRLAVVGWVRQVRPAVAVTDQSPHAG